MNITTRKRRARKGIPWIKHHYSKWYRLKLSLGQMMAASVAAQGLAQIRAIQATKSADKLGKALAIADTVIKTQVAANKASRQFI